MVPLQKRPVAWLMILAVFHAMACGGSSNPTAPTATTAPTAPQPPAPQGTQTISGVSVANGRTDSSGEVNLPAGQTGGEVTVRVVDAGRAPLAGIEVGYLDGPDFQFFIGHDPLGRFPDGYRVLSSAGQLTSFTQNRGDAIHTAEHVLELILGIVEPVVLEPGDPDFNAWEALIRWTFGLNVCISTGVEITLPALSLLLTAGGLVLATPPIGFIFIVTAVVGFLFFRTLEERGYESAEVRVCNFPGLPQFSLVLIKPPSNINMVEVVGGVYVDRNHGLIGTAFLFNPATSAGTIDQVNFIGPSGWNSGSPLTLSRYQPPGTAPSRSLGWRFIPPVTGTYTAQATVGGQAFTGSFSVNPADQLAATEITALAVLPGQATINWIDPPGARSTLVRINPDPYTGVITREEVVAIGSQPVTFTALPLVSGQQYQAVVFSFSQDVRAPDPLAGAFNIGAHGIDFTAP